MAVKEKTKIGIFDMTPTWTALLPSLLALLEDGSPRGKIVAREELARMAKIADAYAALQKGQ